IYYVLDYYMANKPFDWITGYKRQQDSAIVASLERRKKFKAKMDSVTGPALPIEKIAGTFNESLLGEVVISREDTSMVMRFSNAFHFVADLYPFHNSTFIARFRNMDFSADSYLTFRYNADGTIESAKLEVLDPASQMDFDD